MLQSFHWLNLLTLWKASHGAFKRDDGKFEIKWKYFCVLCSIQSHLHAFYLTFTQPDSNESFLKLNKAFNSFLTFLSLIFSYTTNLSEKSLHSFSINPVYCAEFVPLSYSAKPPHHWKTQHPSHAFSFQKNTGNMYTFLHCVQSCICS